MRQGADLVQHEACGGHTILKHLGRDADFLDRRMKEDQTVIGAVSSFTDLETAERAVALALSKRAKEVREWATGQDEWLTVKAPLPRDEDWGLVLNPQGVEVVPQRVLVRMRRRSDGSVHVFTAYLEGR